MADELKANVEDPLKRDDISEAVLTDKGLRADIEQASVALQARAGADAGRF